MVIQETGLSQKGPVRRVLDLVAAGRTAIGRLRRERGAFDPVSILAGVSVITIMSAVAYAYWPVLYGNAMTGACIQNLNAIADAAELYHAQVATHIYPTTQTVGATTFTDAAGVNLLQTVPRDQSDRTGTGTYTFTNTSANGVDSYIVTCPGVHSTSSLQGLPGWKTTSKTIYQSGGQTYTN